MSDGFVDLSEMDDNNDEPLTKKRAAMRSSGNEENDDVPVPQPPAHRDGLQNDDVPVPQPSAHRDGLQNDMSDSLAATAHMDKLLDFILRRFKLPLLRDAILFECGRSNVQRPKELIEFALRAIGQYRAQWFRALVKDVCVRTWNNHTQTSNIVAPMCAKIASASGLADERSSDIVVGEAVAHANKLIAQWKSHIERWSAVCSERKAKLDKLLKETQSRFPCALRCPPYLDLRDELELEEMIENTTSPVRLVHRIEVRLVRRARLLAELRPLVAHANIPLSATHLDGPLFQFLTDTKWPRSRATASALRNDVKTSVMRGDIFAALPQLALARICDFAQDDQVGFMNLCSVSDSFALAAAIWVVRCKIAVPEWSVGFRDHIDRVHTFGINYFHLYNYELGIRSNSRVTTARRFECEQ